MTMMVSAFSRHLEFSSRAQRDLVFNQFTSNVGLEGRIPQSTTEVATLYEISWLSPRGYSCAVEIRSHFVFIFGIRSGAIR